MMFVISRSSNSEKFLDQFSWTSSVNSPVESVCPHEGHLLLYGLTTSLIDLSIFILATFFPHFPQTTSTDIIVSCFTQIIKNPLESF